MQLTSALALVGALALTSSTLASRNIVTEYQAVAVVTTTVTLPAGQPSPAPKSEPEVHHVHQEFHMQHLEAAKPSAKVVPPPTVYVEQKDQTQPKAPAPAPPAPAQSTTPASPPATNTGGDAPPSDMADGFSKHNSYRQAHSAPALQWSSELAASAAASNAKIGCVMQHTDEATLAQLGAGENLASGDFGGSGGATDMWYAEGKQYDYANGGFSDATGHFTQLVWIGSGSFGCATFQCDNPIFRCQYKAPGNYAGEYQTNVLPPK